MAGGLSTQRKNFSGVGEMTVVASDSAKCHKRHRSLDKPTVQRVIRGGKCRIISRSILPSSEGVLSREVTRVTSDNATRLVLAANKANFSPESVAPRTARSVVSEHMPKVPRTVHTCDVAVAGHTVLDHSATNVHGGALVVGLPKDPGTMGRDLRCVVSTLKRNVRVVAKRTKGYTEWLVTVAKVEGRDDIEVC